MKKKWYFSLILLTSLLSFSSCHKTDTYYDYSLYYSYQNAEKGIEVFCWQDKGSWQSGILPGTNRLKSVEEVEWIQANLPCPLAKMREILDTYEEEMITVILVSNPPLPSELTHEIREDDNAYAFLMEALGLGLE